MHKYISDDVVYGSVIINCSRSTAPCVKHQHAKLIDQSVKITKNVLKKYLQL